MRIAIIIFSTLAIFAQSCLSDDGAQVVCDPIPVSQQDQIIDDYIADNNMPMQVTTSGLRYSIDAPGTGDNVVYGDTITVDYRGALLDGTLFDEGTLGPPSFPFLLENSFIPGFEEGLLLLNEGAQATLIIPGALGYGCFPPQGTLIGDNEILIFEITMVSVNP